MRALINVVLPEPPKYKYAWYESYQTHWHTHIHTRKVPKKSLLVKVEAYTKARI